MWSVFIRERSALALLLVCISSGLVSAQATGRIVGRVLAADGRPAEALVSLDSTPLAPLKTTDEGTFVVEALAPGRHVVVARGVDGISEGTAAVTVQPDGEARIEIVLQLAFSEQVVVTESRSGQLRREVPASIDAISAEEVADVRPTHASEIVGSIPGVWVSITGGEGHQTAIRQPLTTSPVYLFLEDGVPTRSTGFFNHNALYEVNLPAAGGIEVTRGPGSALYGSDAIGGVVNVLTKSSLDASGVSAFVEAGGDGWRRALADVNWSREGRGVRATANVTHGDGWRAATAYDRQSGTVRADWLHGSALTKVLVSANRIDQQTAGSSVLPEVDYSARPAANLTPVSFREVDALRVSLDHQRLLGAATLSVVPYYRYDAMDLLPNWTLTFDPTTYTTRNHSIGVLAKVQRDFAPLRATVIAGADSDWSPGDRVEDIVQAVTTPSGLPSGRRVFSSYTRGARIYDYAVTYFSASPYVQAELSPSERLRLSAGLRADYMRYDYDDRLATAETARHRRPADAVRTFTHLSPKLGVTYQLAEAASVFAGYRHAFRAPSEGQLFRQGSSRNTLDLEPVRADNLEAGLRFWPRRGVSVDVSVYQLVKRDDILSYRDPLDGLTTAVNAGKTRHRGVEVGMEWSSARWGFQIAYAYNRHTYDEWVIDPSAGITLSGFEQEAAPRHLGSATLRFTPNDRLAVAAEMSSLGEYWMDANNTSKYGGHTVFNVRGQAEVVTGVRAVVKVLNLFDRLYAESASYTISRGRELAPGRPRTVFAGIELDWRR